MFHPRRWLPSALAAGLGAAGLTAPAALAAPAASPPASTPAASAPSPAGSAGERSGTSPVPPGTASPVRVQVRADALRVLNTQRGETARADGHVTITIPGEVRIEAPSAQLFKGSDGQLAAAVFPGWVRVTDLKPAPEGRWKSEHNRGGRYDFHTRRFTEIAPDGVFEFTPRRTSPSPAPSA